MEPPGAARPEPEADDIPREPSAGIQLAAFGSANGIQPLGSTAG